MKEKIKEILKSYLPGFILGFLSVSIVVVYAETYFPSKDTTYDNKESGLQSTNVQDAIDELYGVCFPPTPPASDTITDLLPSNPDELYKDDKGNIRYYGANPNNYVSFNNELWRIIGVIDGKIKIIRNEPLPIVIRDNQNGTNVIIGNNDKFYWNNVQQSGKNLNNWEKSTLQTYLNGTYYNSIDNTYRRMISEETYYLGGPSVLGGINDYLTSSQYYDAERSNNVRSGNPTSVKQYIGLMYPSDYGYAAGENCSATRLSSLSSECRTIDYLLTNDDKAEWLQTPAADNDKSAASVTDYGLLNSSVVNGNGNLDVRPVLYLTSETQITGGDGSQSNPFQLSL